MNSVKNKDRELAEMIRSSSASVQPLSDFVKATCASIEEKIARAKTIGPDPITLEDLRKKAAEAAKLSSKTHAVTAMVAAKART